MRRSGGISNVAIVVILMVLGVILAILVYFVASGATVGWFRTRSSSYAATNLEIVGFTPTDPPDHPQASVLIKNIGPVSVHYDNIQDWQVFIDERQCSVALLNPPPPNDLDVNRQLNITLSCYVDPTTSHTIKVFGPQATQAFAGWSPG